MSTKNERVTGDELLITGVQQHFTGSATLVVEGKKYKVSEIVSTLQSRIDAAKAVAGSRTAWRDLVATEQRTLAATKSFVVALKQVLTGTYGPSMEALGDFGLAPRKVRALTVDEKAAAVGRSKATRAARHTMGKRAKAKVKASVDEPSDATPAPIAAAPAPVVAAVAPVVAPTASNGAASSALPSGSS